MAGRAPQQPLPERCGVEGCGGEPFAKGYCQNHYYRLNRYGDPLGGKMFRQSGPCKIDGCSKPAKTIGLCNAHYRRHLRHGDPTLGRPTMNGDPMAWLLAHVGHDGHECLPWPYWRNSAGYGHVQYEGHNTAAAHVMCILVNGPPPTPEHEVAHDCGKGNEGCVHPGHIRWDTRQGNMADKVKHGTAPIGSNHPQAKLTDAQVRYIRSSNKLQRELAEELGVTISCISSVVTRRTWPHLL